MKLLIATLIFVSTTAFAKTTVLKIDSVDFNIREISVDDQGKVMVFSKQRAFPTIFFLSAANKQEMMDKINVLSVAQLSKEVRSVVCQTLIAPMNERHLSVLKDGELKVVLTSSDCTQSIVVYPTDKYIKLLSYELRSEMIALARQYFTYSR